MQYKIGDVAKILGISPDLLRYYEKKGVVMPMKGKHNDYRYYDFWDINFLLDCLWFKNFGFSIDQIADMVKIPSSDELNDLFLKKEDELQATIARCELLLRRSEEYRRDLRLSKELLGVCDRILVMSGGRIAGEVDAADTSQEEILTLAAKYV